MDDPKILKHLRLSQENYDKFKASNQQIASILKNISSVPEQQTMALTNTFNVK